MKQPTRILNLLLLVGIAAAMIGCSTSKQITYFQNINEMDSASMRETNDYEAKIKKDDRLSIVVSGADKSVCAPYNLTLGDMGTTSYSSTDPARATLPYLVDAQGNINFPILGSIHVEGMTRNQLVNYLEAEIGKDVKDPVVYVSFDNYRITVLGEVRSPGTYTIDSEKCTLLQALGRAGDLALTAKRKNIILIREENGEKKHYMLDLTDAASLTGPTYYMQQNDVIYVPASNLRIANGTMATSIWSIVTSTLSTSISVATLAVTVSTTVKRTSGSSSSN